MPSISFCVPPPPKAPSLSIPSISLLCFDVFFLFSQGLTTVPSAAGPAAGAAGAGRRIRRRGPVSRTTSRVPPPGGEAGRPHPMIRAPPGPLTRSRGSTVTPGPVTGPGRALTRSPGRAIPSLTRSTLTPGQARAPAWGHRGTVRSHGATRARDRPAAPRPAWQCQGHRHRGPGRSTSPVGLGPWCPVSPIS
eukprot:745663-Hanusia_phi.AAC.2